MSLKSIIIDAITKKPASVTIDGEVSVITSSYPPLMKQKVKPFRQFLTVDGLTGGTSDMGVDGSSNNVEYFIRASENEDRYITSLNFIVGYGASGKPYEWANGLALTNGSRLFYSSEQGEIEIHEGIKTNQDFFRLSFSLIPTAWEVRHVNALNDYGYFISIDLTKLGLTYGVKLDKGTQQKLSLTIRDNAGTDADSFNCIAYGFDRFK